MPEDSTDNLRPPFAGRTSIANRDKPLFTSRRRQQQQPEFTTESLNTTFIPSPSPTKPTSSSPTLAKPRQARGHTRGFGAALEAIESRREAGNKNLRKYPTSHSQYILSKDASPRQSLEASPSPSPRSMPSRSATRTPSPRRGRPFNSLISPISDASSPPRGLAEAYQRINDEEDLAALENKSNGSLPEEDDEGGSEVLQDTSNQQNPHPSILSSSSSRRSSRRGSRIKTPPGSAEVVMSEVDEATQNSGPSSASQDLLQYETSQRASVSRREKDQQRVDSVLGADIQPFRKAKRRSGLTLGGLRRDETSSQSGSSSFGSSATGSIVSDPALNIPQGWGRKARHGRTWLHRIGAAKSDTDLQQSPVTNKNHQNEERLRAIEDWQATASLTPLPPVTESDSLQASSPPEGKDNTLHQSTLSRDRARRWELGDTGFMRPHTTDGATGRVRTSAIDLIREREIQNLTKSAVTTNRLGELKERRSLERVGHRSSSASTESLVRQENKDEDQGDRPIIQEPLDTSGGGGPVSDSPAVITNSRSSTPTQNGSVDRPKLLSKERSTRKHDARDILRQLARVASPDPPKAVEATERFVRSDSGPKNEGYNAKASKPEALRSSDQAAELNERSSKPQKVVKSTPQQSKNHAYTKTPVAPGGWIDTPMPAPGQQLLAQSQQSGLIDKSRAVNPKIGESLAPEVVETGVSRPSLEDTAPKLPRSALSAIIEKAKAKKSSSGIANDDTLQLDDSTIESLEGLLASSEGDQPSSSPPTPPESLGQNISRKPLRKIPVQRTRKLHRQKDDELDSEGYNHLTSRLSHLQSSISEAKQGVGSLQKRLRKTSRKGANRALSRSNSQSGVESECDEAGEFHDFIWPCEKCGHSRGSSIYDNEDGTIWEWQWRPVQILIPNLWFWPSWGKVPRLTRLGWWATLACALVVAELILW